MNHFVKVGGYLLAANGQAVCLIIGADYFVRHLETAYPRAFSWGAVVWPLVVATTLHTYYIIIRAMIRWDKARDFSNKPTEED